MILIAGRRRRDRDGSAGFLRLRPRQASARGPRQSLGGRGKTRRPPGAAAAQRVAATSAGTNLAASTVPHPDARSKPGLAEKPVTPEKLLLPRVTSIRPAARRAFALEPPRR